MHEKNKNDNDNNDNNSNNNSNNSNNNDNDNNNNDINNNNINEKNVNLSEEDEQIDNVGLEANLLCKKIKELKEQGNKLIMLVLRPIYCVEK